MLWRSALLGCLFVSPAAAQTACPSAVLRVVIESIEIYKDRDFRQSAGRVAQDQVPEGTPITACFGGIAYQIQLGGNFFWIRRTGLRTQTGGLSAPPASDKVIPYGAGGRGVFE